MDFETVEHHLATMHSEQLKRLINEIGNQQLRSIEDLNEVGTRLFKWYQELSATREYIKKMTEKEVPY